MVALIVTDITNPFWTTVARGVEDACNEHDVNLIVCNTDERQNKLENYINLLLQRQIDKEHYIKPELDARFQSLETTFRQGFEGLRAEFKELSRVLLEHIVNVKVGKNE